MIGTLDVKINAAHPNLPLTPFYTFVSSPSSVRVTNVPKKIGSWEITKVFVTANYPDNTSRSAECVNVAGCYVATLPLCNVVGESVNGFQITANGVDENGNAVTGYVLGHGDLIVLTRAGNITVGTTTWYFNFKDTQPTNPVKGDACIINGALKWYNGTAWVDFGGLNLSDITLDLNADQATINEKLGEVIRRAGGTVIGCLLLFAAPLAAWCAHVYPTNPDPSHKEFFGKMTRDSLVVTNAPDLVETDPTAYSKITNSVLNGYLCTVEAANAMTNDDTIVRGERSPDYWNVDVLNAVNANNAPWSGITDTPTTLSGYGITDAYEKNDTVIIAEDQIVIGSGGVISLFMVDGFVAGSNDGDTKYEDGKITKGGESFILPYTTGILALTTDIPDAYTKGEMNTILAQKASAEDVYTKTQADDKFITASTATNILRSANAGVWDAALSVWWTPVMSNGKLTYQATTNVNLNAGN